MDEKNLKISTVDCIHNVLHQVFQVAVDDDIIRSNPVTSTLRELKMALGLEVEKRKALTVEQERIFLEYLQTTPKYIHWFPIFYVMAYTGMRVGEITGLRWCDIDIENGMIIFIPELQLAIDEKRKELTNEQKIKWYMLKMNGFDYYLFPRYKQAIDIVYHVRNILKKKHLYFDTNPESDIKTCREKFEMFLRQREIYI